MLLNDSPVIAVTSGLIVHCVSAPPSCAATTLTPSPSVSLYVVAVYARFVGATANTLNISSVLVLPPLSLALTLTHSPGYTSSLAVPLIVPVELSSVSPIGNCPALTLYTSCAPPAVAPAPSDAGRSTAAPFTNGNVPFMLLA